MSKIIIKKEDLPPISADDEGYNLRFRLISQDRNRSSFWTPLITIDAPSVTEIPYGLEEKNQSIIINGVSQNKKTVRAFWTDTQYLKEYDVYVKWYASANDPNAVWEYAGSTFADNVTLVDYGNHTHIQVAIQKTTYPKIYTQKYALFTSIKLTL